MLGTGAGLRSAGKVRSFALDRGGERIKEIRLLGGLVDHASEQAQRLIFLSNRAGWAGQQKAKRLVA